MSNSNGLPPIDLLSTISLGDQSIGLATWAHICCESSNKTGHTRALCVGFDDLRVLADVSIRRDDDLCLSYTAGEHVLESLDLRATETLHFTSSQSMYVFECPTEFDYLSLCIVRAWIRGLSSMTWQALPSPILRNAWLNACLRWRQISPPKRVPRSIGVHIDTNAIDCPEDMFCALGEATLGHRGYMGKGLDSFEECLKELVFREGMSIKFHIEAQDIFREKVRTFSGDGNFFGSFMEILKECGCTVCSS
jgi:hypothetical protein